MPKKTYYILHWSGLLPEEYKAADDGDKAMSWNVAKYLNASEVARRLEAQIIPKMLNFELAIRLPSGAEWTVIEGDESMIKINRRASISPTILKVLA